MFLVNFSVLYNVHINARFSVVFNIEIDVTILF